MTVRLGRGCIARSGSCAGQWGVARKRGAGVSWRWAGADSRRGGWWIAQNSEMSAHKPVCPDKKLQLVLPGEPFFRRKFQTAGAITATVPLPCTNRVVNHFTVTPPDLCPLDTIGHHVVTVGPKDCLKGVFKFRGRLDRLQVLINIGREFDRAEDICVLRRTDGFKLVDYFLR